MVSTLDSPKLFSPSIIRDLSENQTSQQFKTIVESSGMLDESFALRPTSELFELNFKQLNKVGSRNDYIFRSAITQKILIGNHSLKTATMLNEFRLGSSIADAIMLNGTSTVYEIKSDLDSIFRLPSQLANYRRSFAQVCVVTGDSHLEEVLRSSPNDIGIIRLSSNYTLQMIRPPEDRPDLIDPDFLTRYLRIKEIQQILELLNQELPAVSNIQLRGELSKVFSRQDPLDFHRAMLQVLKQNRSQHSLSKLIKLIPKSLWSATLQAKIPPKQCAKLAQVLQIPLQELMTASK